MLSKECKACVFINFILSHEFKKSKLCKISE